MNDVNTMIKCIIRSWAGTYNPFKCLGCFQNDRVSLEKLLVLKPNDVVIVDMMAKMFVSHVLIRAVRGTT